MITAICMNPSFDRTVETGTMTPGAVNRVLSSRTDPGGKGINVAVVLKRLGVPCRCVGCAGEDGIDRLSAMLDAENLEHHLMRVPGAVRTNLKIVTPGVRGVTEINEAGPSLSPASLQRFFEMAEGLSEDSDIIAVTGSLPAGCPEGTYRDLLRRFDGRKTLLDVGGRELLLGAEARPFLIKPNLPELEGVLQTSLRSHREIRDAAMRFISLGVRHVIVSLGGDGAVLVTEDGKCYLAPALDIPVRSTVGAGDAMVGGFLYGYETSGGDVLEAFRCGAAAGNASVMTEGTRLIVPDDFRELLGRITLQEVC